MEMKTSLLLLIKVGTTPYEGNVGEKGAIDYIYNTLKFPVSNDAVAASNGKSMGGGKPAFKYPG